MTDASWEKGTSAASKLFPVFSEMGKMKKMKSFATVLVASVFLLAGCRNRPNDSEMSQLFYRHRSSLSNIVQELKVHRSIERMEWDGSVVIVNNGANSALSASNFVSEFKRIGQPVLLLSGGKVNKVQFVFYRHGLSVSGSMKGISYLESVPPRIVADTDKGILTNSPFSVFRLIETNWYIFHSR